MVLHADNKLCKTGGHSGWDAPAFSRLRECPGKARKPGAHAVAGGFRMSGGRVGSATAAAAAAATTTATATTTTTIAAAGGDAARDVARDTVLAVMSHEVRTPLNGIMGFTDLLIDTDLTDEQREYVRVISASSRLLLRLTENMLDFTRLRRGVMRLDPEPVDVRALVKETLDNLSPRASGKKLRLLHSVSPSVPRRVLCDPVRVRQVLLNLADNAVKFTPAGEVEVSVRVSTAAKPAAVAKPADTALILAKPASVPASANPANANAAAAVSSSSDTAVSSSTAAAVPSSATPAKPAAAVVSPTATVAPAAVNAAVPSSAATAAASAAPPPSAPPPPDLHLEFAVRDTGIGVAPEDHARLFKPFGQLDSSCARRYEGAGLGLVIARDLTRLMGGGISVISDKNKGSTFLFTIACRGIPAPGKIATQTT